jgi:hypothetical protein
MGLSTSVDGGEIAIRIREDERPSEGVIERLRDDRHAILSEFVVKCRRTKVDQTCAKLIRW